jgi:putative tryptophan/tyrosine transport system substrate-binding protein
VNRRAFVTGLGAVLAAPLGAEAQPAGKVPRICVLAADSRSSPWARRYQGFLQGLRDLGYVEGRNIAIDFLSTDGQYDRFPALAVECVGLKPDVIVAYTTPGSLAAKNATKTIPIVTGPIGDPVGTGVVGSLARPGGNVTGQTVMASGLSGKVFSYSKRQCRRSHVSSYCHNEPIQSVHCKFKSSKRRPDRSASGY